MEGNLAKYIEKHGNLIPGIDRFYENLRRNNLDLFVFDTYYLTILHDRKREFDKDDSVKLNKGDIEELAKNVDIIGMNHQEMVKKGLLKPYRRIYLSERKDFDEKGIAELLENKRIVLSESVTSIWANNYR